MPFKPGRHFLQIPGPTNVPDRVLRAIAQPTIDHRGPAFSAMAREAIAGLQRIFQTAGAVIVYPSSGTGAWEAALVNTLSPGDSVLLFETGHFATLWRDMAVRLGLTAAFVPGDWRRGGAAAAGPRRLGARGGRGGGGAEAFGRPRPFNQGRRDRSQRDVERRPEPHSAGTA